jgi:hypothetical protein
MTPGFKDKFPDRNYIDDNDDAAPSPDITPNDQPSSEDPSLLEQWGNFLIELNEAERQLDSLAEAYDKEYDELFDLYDNQGFRPAVEIKADIIKKIGTREDYLKQKRPELYARYQELKDLLKEDA